MEECDGLVAARGAGNNFHVILSVDDQGDTVADYAVIVDAKNTNLRLMVGRHAFAGNRASTRVPACSVVRTVNAPPTWEARSRMLTRP
jgi:hypothetical protein